MAEQNTATEFVNNLNQSVATEETKPETEIVTETTTETAPQTTTETAIVEETKVEATTAPIAETQAVDYSQFLSKESEGLFNDVDSFKAALPKIKEYDALVSQKTELEEKLKASPFVNDFVKTVNELIKEGKSAEEVENFIKISKLDIDQISAIDAKVMVMVKNGYSEAIAKQIVEQEFPIEDFEEGTTERQILEEKLRVSSLQDRQVLKDYKKELTTIDTSAKEQAEQQRLAQIAQHENFTKTIKSAVPQIAQTFTGLGEKVIGKNGEEDVKLTFDYPEEFRAELTSKLEGFFLDGQMEATPENIETANRWIRADYLEQNFDAISQSIYKTAYSLGAEAMVNKYENRTGLPPETTNVVVDNTAKEKAEFLTRIAHGK